MPAPRRHPLVAAVRRALPRPRPESATAFLALLDRRLRRLASVTGGPRGAGWNEPAASRALARRFLEPLEGTWDDGDENLVRGYLDRWVAAGEDAERAAAGGLLEAAGALSRIEARAGTLWFFLWEMESVLRAFVADKPRGPC
ncbi:MAG: hypothetical protein HY317_00470 [Acidobacteria bacterium]|nr:hypothetical protein [Acidobacteriota bacterium]